MSRRRRHTAVAINYNEHEDSEEELGRSFAKGRSRRVMGRTPAKRWKSSSASPRLSKGSRRRSGNASTSRATNRTNQDSSVICIDINPTDDVNYEEKVRSRMNSYFKTSVLLSDDEDELPAVVEPTASESRFSRSLYVLSDSDDGNDDVLLTTSVDNSTFDSLVVHNTASEEHLSVPTTSITDSNRDELLEVVDDILKCTDTVAIKKPEKSVVDWIARTDEVMESVDSIIEELYEKTGTKPNEKPKKVEEKVEPVVTEASPKEVRTCPVCLDGLGGKVQAATTFCGHLFCRSCITQVAKISKKCPTCRKGVTIKKIVPIYL